MAKQHRKEINLFKRILRIGSGSFYFLTNLLIGGHCSPAFLYLTTTMMSMRVMMMMWGKSGRAHHVCLLLPYGSDYRLRPAKRRHVFPKKNASMPKHTAVNLRDVLREVRSSS